MHALGPAGDSSLYCARGFHVFFALTQNENFLLVTALRLSSLLCVFLQWGKRQQSRTYSYGWIRAEVIGALINAIFLLSGASNGQAFLNDNDGTHTTSFLVLLPATCKPRDCVAEFVLKLWSATNQLTRRFLNVMRSRASSMASSSRHVR